MVGCSGHVTPSSPLICYSGSPDCVLDSLLEFCPREEEWRLVARLPRPRADHAMLVQDDM